MSRIDLAKIEAAAVGPEDEPATVSRAMLRQIVTELREGREAQRKLGAVFAGEGKAL